MWCVVSAVPRRARKNFKIATDGCWRADAAHYIIETRLLKYKKGCPGMCTLKKIYVIIFRAMEGGD